jgi:hypothetical protein
MSYVVDGLAAGREIFMSPLGTYAYRPLYTIHMHNNGTIQSSQLPQTTMQSVANIDQNNGVLCLKFLKIKFLLLCFQPDTDH